MSKSLRRSRAVRAKVTGAPLNLGSAINVDLFAGGGGASTGIERGLGCPVHIAINHNPKALSMHQANHPEALHLQEDIWAVDPVAVLAGRSVGWLHASPDCTHHSQAAGGQPRKQEIRSLAWVITKWLALSKPAVLSMENVKQMRTWGPLVAKRDKATGRVIKLVEVQRGKKTKIEQHIAEPGERVPRQQQYLVPDPKRAGQTWRRFLASIERMGYELDHTVKNAADYGAATSRQRLYLVARRDGEPVCWPAPTHCKAPAPGSDLKPYRVTADHIDWSIPCPSIFLTKEEARAQGLNVKRPLADATLRRIAEGVMRFVINTPEPFIVNTRNGEREGQQPRCRSINQPFWTVTAQGSQGALCMPRLAPLETHFMIQANGGFNTVPARSVADPCSTITSSGSQQQLASAFMVHLRKNLPPSTPEGQLPTIVSAGQHHALVQTVMASPGECGLTPEQVAGALRVSAFLMRYYSSGGQWGAVTEPMHTITTKDRLALVTVTWCGTTWVIVDIGLRMLVPKELYGCQGMPRHYIHDRGHDGTLLSITDQVLMVGNSVSPPPMAAIARANNPYKQLQARRAA
ncbi:DNA cytosine methyltransferase [Aeromonas caviae]|uniref:DNA cytosine methyltransferase n=1 Tax=Aeromonas caviae TaxID=648 RepID=UPI000DD90B30|nr:DNA cytosine methyltransferase [Aeromonas caviae]AXB01400.1 DNA cytosine methyltransferase [Aeromonas caviae]MBL0496239.1 DNA cytosine methyltransferase [Aeromonas caviae]QLL79620.1 DNA cytosine methyltransferase [Aeromonas caviae]